MKLILIFCALSIVGVQSSQDVDGKNYGNVFKPENLKPGPWVEMTKAWTSLYMDGTAVNFFCDLPTSRSI